MSSGGVEVAAESCPKNARTKDTSDTNKGLCKNIRIAVILFEVQAVLVAFMQQKVKNLTQHPSMSFGEVVALPASCSTPGVEPDCLEQLRQDCLAASEKCFCGDYGYLFHEGFASFLETNASEEEGASFFYCCSLESCKHLAHNYDSAGLALLIVGVIGVLISTLYLQLPRRIVTLKPNDEEYLAPAWRGDGAALHDQVPFHEWCVNLEDLRQFRRLVMHAVAQGQLRPTERDPFEVMDWTVGPSVYTVTDQFITPVTKAAGRMSWALLKHPEGLTCNVFITHCWAEGIYEFLDRVEQSWPRGALGAYVCFLSNPQNLDISRLLASPKESPFAMALASASTVLVIPNERVSIYTRLWCVYEAGLRSLQQFQNSAWGCMGRGLTQYCNLLHFWIFGHVQTLVSGLPGLYMDQKDTNCSCKASRDLASYPVLSKPFSLFVPPHRHSSL